MKKRALAWLLLLAMMITVLPTAAFAEELPKEIQAEETDVTADFSEMAEEQQTELNDAETAGSGTEACEANTSLDEEDTIIAELTAFANENGTDGLTGGETEYYHGEAADPVSLYSEGHNSILPWTTMVGLTIHSGDVARLRFGLITSTSTSGQRYNVLIYKGTEISTANRVLEWYNSCSSYAVGKGSQVINWDTSGLTTGTYTIFYCTTYYTNSEWKIDTSTYNHMSVSITSAEYPLSGFTIGNVGTTYSANSTIKIASTGSDALYSVYLSPSNTTSDRSNLTASSGNTNVFTVSVFGGYLTITPKSNGSAALSVSVGGVTEKFTVKIGSTTQAYTVSYDANGGSGAPAAQTKWKGETLTLTREEPTRSGFRFLGWATISRGDASYYPGESYDWDSNLSLYAVWEAKSGGTGDSRSEAVNISFGTTYEKSWTSTTEDYDYYNKIVLSSPGVICIHASKPWNSYQNAYGSLEFCLDSMSASIWKNKTYYAKSDGNSDYTLYVGLNAGTYYLTIKPDFSVENGYPSETFYVITFNATEYCEREADEVALAPGHLYSGALGGDNYYSNDGEQSDYYKFSTVEGRIYEIVSDNISALLSSTAKIDLIDPGHSRTSIKTDLSDTVNGTGENSYTFTAEATGTYEICIYNYSKAQITYTIGVNSLYTVAYDANGGSGAPDAQGKKDGAALTLSSVEPKRSGYSFLGWSTSRTATEAMYAAGGSYTEDADVTLYAVWESSGQSCVEGHMGQACVIPGTQPGKQNTVSDAYSGWKTISAGYKRWYSDTPLPYELRIDEIFTGSTAYEVVKNENSRIASPSFGREWLLIKFWLKNNGSRTLYASDIINRDDTSFYLMNTRLKTYGTATFENNYEGMGIDDVSIAPGASGYFWYGVLLDRYVPSYPIFTINIGYSEDAIVEYVSTDPKCQTVHDHVWDAGTITTEATCVSTGIKTYTCTECGLTKTETIAKNPNAHSFGAPVYTWSADGTACSAAVSCTRNSCMKKIEESGTISSAVKTAATCTAMGTTTYTAAFTDSHFSVQTKAVEDIAALDHDLVYTEAKVATTTETGNIEYWTCTRCGKIYSDAVGAVEINPEDIVIPLRKSFAVKYVLGAEDAVNDPSNPTELLDGFNRITLFYPTRKGYVFDGWYNSADFADDAYAAAPEVNYIDVESDITLYAKWNPVTYSLTFNGNGTKTGKMPSYTAVLYDEELTLPANAFTLKGYDFTGWNTAKDGTGTSIADKETVCMLANTEGAKVTLYAQWQPAKYTITYVLYGSTNNSTNPQSYTVNSTVTLAAPNGTGLGTFLGWYSDPAFKTKATGIKAGSTGDKTFYAKWSGVTFTISYELFGGVNDPTNPTGYNTGDTVNLLAPAKAPSDDCVFAGWYSDANYKTKVTTIKAGSYGDKTFYAKWTAKTKYTIRYELNGGKNAKNPTSYTFVTPTISLLDPTCKGYTFRGWFNDAQCMGDPVTEIITGTQGDLTLYAKWEKDIYTITYVTRDGTNVPVNPTTYSVDSETIKLQNPTRTGYTFGGWYSDSALKTKVIQIKKGSVGNITLYAKWTANKYTVKFNGNGNSTSKTSGSMPNQSVNYSSCITLKANKFTRKGFVFQGWNTEPDGSGATYKDGATILNLSRQNKTTVILYAQWEAIVYNISYELNGGEAPAEGYPITYTAENAITLANPTKTGYTFAGWYTDAKLKTKASLKAGNIGDKTFYAKWTANKYTVVFNANGGTGKMSNLSMTYDVFKALTGNGFKRAGYWFAGWSLTPNGKVEYTNGQFVSNMTAENKGTVTLYAVWKW